MNGEIRTSVVPGSDRICVPAGASRQVRYGDRIYVRVVSAQSWKTLAEFELNNVSDMSDVFGELRYRTRGQHGLTRIHVRNATRGWSFEQPFKLYGRSEPRQAASVTHPVVQPGRPVAEQPSLWGASETVGKRRIPESVRLRYGL